VAVLEIRKDWWLSVSEPPFDSQLTSTRGSRPENTRNYCNRQPMMCDRRSGMCTSIGNRNSSSGMDRTSNCCTSSCCTSSCCNRDNWYSRALLRANHTIHHHGIRHHLGHHHGIRHLIHRRSTNPVRLLLLPTFPRSRQVML